MWYNMGILTEEGTILKFIIDEKRLRFLLDDKKRNFSISYSESVGVIIAGLSLFFSLFCSEYKTVGGVSGENIKTIIGLVSIIIIIYGGLIFYKTWNRKYTFGHLYNDIATLAESNNNAYSIIAVHNPEQNKYLLYADEQWGCKLFLNYKIREADEQKEVKNLKALLARDLQVPKKAVRLNFQFTQESEKLSIGNNVNKLYEFHFYYACIYGISEQNVLQVGGRTYSWVSIPEMEADPDLMRKNADVVALVKNAIVPRFT